MADQAKQEVGTSVTRREEDPTAPTRLVEIAMERGMGVEVIERLVALQERVEDRNARSAYIRALTSVQEDIREIPQNKTAQIRTRSGSSYEYGYATLDQIARIIRPVLAAHGLSYSWDSDVDEGRVQVTCTLRHVDGHSESASFTAPTETSAAMSEAQKHAAVLTYGRRQSLVQVLGLSIVDQDSDGAGPATPATLTDEQVADVEALIEEVGADRAGFLRWLGVDSVGEIHPKNLQVVIRSLEKKRGQS